MSRREWPHARQGRAAAVSTNIHAPSPSSRGNGAISSGPWRRALVPRARNACSANVQLACDPIGQRVQAAVEHLVYQCVISVLDARLHGLYFHPFECVYCEWHRQP